MVRPVTVSVDATMNALGFDTPCSDLPWHCELGTHRQQIWNVYGLRNEHLDAKTVIADDEHHLVVPGMFIQAFERLCVVRLVVTNASPAIAKNVEADLCIDDGHTIALLHYQEIAQLIGVVRMVFVSNGMDAPT